MNNGKYDKMISVIDMETPNRKPNRIAGYDYSQSGAYFITICTQDRKKILSRISVGTPLLGCPLAECFLRTPGDGCPYEIPNGIRRGDSRIARVYYDVGRGLGPAADTQ
jgi:hypothetical protein